MAARTSVREAVAAGQPAALVAEPFPSLTEGESVANTQQDGFGVDRLSISFPVRRHAEPARWGSVKHRYSDGQVTYQAQVVPFDGGPAVMVGVQTVEGRPWGKVECNPSRFVDPDGCSLLDPRELPAALATMWAAGGELMTPDCSVFEARVRRVDVARDFRGVTKPSLYVDGLAPVKRPYARRSFTYNDPGRGDAQTLYVGSKAGGVRLYDQHEAYAAKGAPPGSLRWEVEARTGWLEKAGVRLVDELDRVVLERFATDRWEWSKMGMTVTGPVAAVDVVKRAIEAGEVSPSVGARLLGEMVLRSAGTAFERDRATEWRNRALSERIGLTCDDLWTNDLDRQASGRLDFHAGIEQLSLVSS